MILIMYSVQIWICVSGFEAGGKKMPSNFAPWTIVGTETTIHVETELSSCFERNKVALRMDVLCDNCPFDGVGISNPGYWGMVRITKKTNAYSYLK